ncbi:MAG: ComF family protein [Deltaproteobacteria bacterium]|nr:ComF family protein [Deltaproteobacteria bacterium]
MARSWGCYPRESDVTHPLRQVIHRFKYGRQASLGKPLGRLMTQASRPWEPASRFDLIIPVPLHPRRLRWRGFNQSVLLGREVGRAWGIPIDPFVLTRKTETAPQSTLSLRERGPNVRGAFAIAPGRAVARMRVLLVDDIYTSGATLNECTRVLLRAGAGEVRALTLARTVS